MKIDKFGILNSTEVNRDRILRYDSLMKIVIKWNVYGHNILEEANQVCILRKNNYTIHGQ